MKRSLTTLALTLSVAALAFSTLTSPAQARMAAPEIATAPEVYSVPFSPDLYSVTNVNTASAQVSKLSYNQWVEMGQPTPKKYPVAYVKYPWQADIYAVSFFGTARNTWVWSHLSLAQWNSVGSPRPETAGWIQGSTFFKQASNAQEIFVQLGQKIHKLTFKEYVAAGSPKPEQYKSEIAGLTWQPTLALFNMGLNQGGTVINFAFWNYLAQPTPRLVKRIKGDTFTQKCGSPDIYYKGLTYSGKLTLDQWKAAGAPEPTMTGTCPAPAPLYQTCADVRAAGKAPIYSWQPGYLPKFDSDGDGKGCE